jgi:hypothetical protein
LKRLQKRYETYEKGLRHVSKIFFASGMIGHYADERPTVNFFAGKAKNI